VLDIDDAAGMVRLLRGPSLSDTPLPKAIIPGGPYDDRHQRNAVLRVAQSVNEGAQRYPALEAIISRERPRIRGLAEASRIHTTELAEIKALALGLDDSFLFIQGPPRSGKTSKGAELITHLIKNQKSVGVAAQSHKVIHNLLKKVESVAREEQLAFRGCKKSTAQNPESVYASEFTTSCSQTSQITRNIREIQLVAGTAWLFSDPQVAGQFDYLVVDEAPFPKIGEFSLRRVTGCILMFAPSFQRPCMAGG
jgi:uncharacterized protein